MSDIYSVNLINITKADDLKQSIQIKCLEIFNELFKSLNFVNKLKELEVNGVKHNVMNFQNVQPNNKDIDGLYFIYNKNIHKFDMYIKKTIENNGYLYNSVDIMIDYVGFIEIIKSNVSFKLDEKQNNELLKLNKIIKEKKKNENQQMINNLNKLLIDELKNKLDNLNMKKKN